VENKPKKLHELVIKDEQIKLDSFNIHGVKSYKLSKSSADSPTELLLLLDVSNSSVRK